MKKKNRRKKLTTTAIGGLLFGFFLMGIGLYYAVLHGASGAYYVTLLGVAFNGVIYWSYRS